MDKISVAHIRDSGGIFGAERHILTIGKNIDKKFHILLICMRSQDKKSELLMEKAKCIGIHVIPVDVRGKIDLKSIYSIRNILKNNNINIIHSHDFKSNMYGFLASVNLGIRRVLTAGGTTRDSLLKKFYMYVDETFTYKCFDNIIAVSREIHDRLRKRNIGAGKIIIIENGIDSSLYDLEFNEKYIYDPLPVDGKKKVFAVIGRLFPDKGHRYFLQAFSELNKKYPTSIALIIGDGPLDEEIGKQVMNLKLEGNVFLCGVRQDMKNIYNNIDCLVIPSLTEGLPYVLLEAMLCRVPVLATDVGGIPGLVTNEKTGYLVPPGDVESLKIGMEKMLDNPEKSEEMAENAYNLVMEKYSAKRMVDHIGRVYNSLVDT